MIQGLLAYEKRLYRYKQWFYGKLTKNFRKIFYKLGKSSSKVFLFDDYVRGGKGI